MKLEQIVENVQTHVITKDPHLLFVGKNGHKTYGIAVKSLEPKSEVEDRGYRRQWTINDHSIAKYNLAFLGLTPDEEQTLKTKVQQLSQEQV